MAAMKDCFVCGRECDVGFLLCHHCEQIFIEDMKNGVGRLAPLYARTREEHKLVYPPPEPPVVEVQIKEDIPFILNEKEEEKKPKTPIQTTLF